MTYAEAKKRLLRAGCSIAESSIRGGSHEVNVMAPKGHCYFNDCHERIFRSYESMRDAKGAVVEEVFGVMREIEPCDVETCPSWIVGEGCDFWNSMDDAP